MVNNPMDMILHDTIKAVAQPYYSDEDRSHDFLHAKRVVCNAMLLQKTEGGDLDIIVAGAYFHDCVKHDKSGVRYKLSTIESGDALAKELERLPDYPKEKITAARQIVLEHSYTAGMEATSLESKILQDADRLETLGAMGIARIFSSTGYMKCAFYNEYDPFCETRLPNEKNIAVDFMLARSFAVAEKMNTVTARDLAAPRIALMKEFLLQFADEAGMVSPKNLDMFSRKMEK